MVFSSTPNHRQILVMAIPIILANSATHLAAATTFLLALLWLGGDFFVAQLTILPTVRELAHSVLPFGVAYVFLSFVVFQLDGIYRHDANARIA